MIETIAVARVLREAVTTPYLNLVTRPTGVAVRGRIESVLATSEWETAMLDFSDVVLLDLSCADEVVAKLVRMAQERLGRVVAHRAASTSTSGNPSTRCWSTSSSRSRCSPTGRSRCWVRCPATCSTCSTRLEPATPLRGGRAVAATRVEPTPAPPMRSTQPWSLGVCRRATGGYVRLPLA